MSTKPSSSCSTTSYPWRQIIIATAALSPAETEELAYELMTEYRAEGTVQESGTTLLAYFRIPHAACQEIIAELCRKYAVSATIDSVIEQNWSAASEQVWQAVEEGDLRVQPVATESMAEPPTASEIRIYPGTGFGTGQHHTTRMLLRLLQDPTIAAMQPSAVLDVGTGSGILAIAAARLLPCPVVAFDTDPLATGNAGINLSLNHCSHRIRLFTGSISDCAETFDLILANLYAELLIEMEPLLRARGTPGGRILLSGILQELWPEVQLCFESHGAVVEKVYVGDELYPVAPNDKIWVAACLRWGEQ